ncbi:oxidoreductase [Nocardia miyunensis]|uniref:oxidoreductase n=1 Tax=Nocardia miyunensis TaxID=282684 RepID=UPI0008340833|nr:NAD(P)-binding protein [Nocardia miyunensis]
MQGAALTPLHVGGMQLRSRIVRTAHGVLLPWSDDGGGQVDYHVARAKGGVALAIMGIGGVHPSNPTVVPTHEDRVVPGLRAIVEAVHAHGMNIVVQIWHGGAIKPNMLGGPPWSPSGVPGVTTGIIPIAMTKTMIDEMVSCFADAARRIRAAGADGVEIHGANGYLITQFLSRATNFRTDEYGGSLENRTRFAAEILDAVRAEVTDDFTVGLRLSSNEYVENGIVPEEAAQIARALEDRIDYLNVSLGGYWRPDMIAGPADMPMGYQLDQSRVVTEAVSVPTIVTGRIMTMDEANRIVESGIADMVSMVRGLIADPEIVTKSVEDRTEQIRPCIGAVSCIGSTLSGTFACTVNPSAGHERERPAPETIPAASPRKVLVVGGGPAGMEAARCAAARGHHVSLYEMRRELGGQVNLVASAPFRSDFKAITMWQADELRRLGVRVRVNTPVDPDVVAAEQPDVLVLATGSEANSTGVQLMRPATPVAGFGLPHVYSGRALFESKKLSNVRGTAVVFDDLGEYDALAVADELVARQVEVVFVTPFDSFGERLAARVSTVGPTLRRLVEARVRLVPRSRLQEIRTGEVIVRGGGVDSTFAADSVFFVGLPEPNRDLLDYLDDFTGEVRMIGDAAGFHTLMRAIHDGDRAGREI